MGRYEAVVGAVRHISFRFLIEPQLDQAADGFGQIRLIFLRPRPRFDQGLRFRRHANAD
jgi:hypothetical protein